MARVLKCQQQLSLLTESGNLVLNPAGTITASKAVTFGDASTTRTNLGLAINSDVQAHHAFLDDISNLAPNNGDRIQWNGSNFISVAPSEEATTASAPLTMQGSDVQLSLDAGNLEVNGSSELAIKAGGVGATELAADCVNGDKIADDSVGSEHLAAQAVDASALHADVAGNGLAGGNGSALSIDTSVTADLSTAQTLSNKTLAAPTHTGVALHNGGQSWSYAEHSVTEATTADATPANVTVDTLADDELKHYEVVVMARDQTSKDKACYKLSFCASRDTGAASTVLESSPGVEVLAEDDASWNVDANVNTADGAVRVEVTGDASNSCRWVIRSVATRVS